MREFKAEMGLEVITGSFVFDLYDSKGKFQESKLFEFDCRSWYKPNAYRSKAWADPLPTITTVLAHIDPVVICDMTMELISNLNDWIANYYFPEK